MKSRMDDLRPVRLCGAFSGPGPTIGDGASTAPMKILFIHSFVREPVQVFSFLSFPCWYPFVIGP